MFLKIATPVSLFLWVVDGEGGYTKLKRCFGSCMKSARNVEGGTGTQNAEVHFFVEKVKSKKKSSDL